MVRQHRLFERRYIPNASLLSLISDARRCRNHTISIPIVSLLTFPHAFLFQLRGMGSAATNKVGQNIPAELFRHHKCSVLLLGYVDNVGDMVTVDQNGYVFIWSYTE